MVNLPAWLALSAMIGTLVLANGNAESMEPALLREPVDQAAATPVPAATVWQQRRIHEASSISSTTAPCASVATTSRRLPGSPTCRLALNRLRSTWTHQEST